MLFRSVLLIPPGALNIRRHRKSNIFHKYIAKRLLAATSWLYRLRLSVLFDSIQLIAPEFYERELYLMTSGHVLVS